MIASGTEQAYSRAPALNREQMRRCGWQVIHWGQGENVGCEREMLEWVRGFADPVAVAPGTEVWPIRPRPAVQAPTFSETAGPAPLHTDGQYRRKPEDAFVLFCVSPASEGGESLLLSVRVVLEKLRELGSHTEKILRTARIPFRAPVAFGGTSVGWHRVIVRDRLVWRADTIDQQLLAEIDRKRQIRTALAELQRAIDSLSPTTVPLRAGDALVVDNGRMLHGRAGFTDPKRLLFRIRFDWR